MHPNIFDTYWWSNMSNTKARSDKHRKRGTALFPIIVKFITLYFNFSHRIKKTVLEKIISRNLKVLSLKIEAQIIDKPFYFQLFYPQKKVSFLVFFRVLNINNITEFRLILINFFNIKAIFK